MKKTHLPLLVKSLAEESKALLEIGARGSGKTATAYYLAEKVHQHYPEKKVYIINHPQPKILPRWMHNASTLREAPNNSLLIIDEASLEYASRNSLSKKNKSLSTILPILRHKDQSAIFITQNASLSDVNLVRLVDIILVKKPSLLQVKTERSATKAFVKAAQEMLRGKDKTYSYVLFDEEETLIQTPLPSFWSKKQSKAWEFRNEEENLEMPETNLVEEGLPPAHIPTPVEAWKILKPERQKGFLKAWHYAVAAEWAIMYLPLKGITALKNRGQK